MIRAGTPMIRRFAEGPAYHHTWHLAIYHSHSYYKDTIIHVVRVYDPAWDEIIPVHVEGLRHGSYGVDDMPLSQLRYINGQQVTHEDILRTPICIDWIKMLPDIPMCVDALFRVRLSHDRSVEDIKNTKERIYFAIRQWQKHTRDCVELPCSPVHPA